MEGIYELFQETEPVSLESERVATGQLAENTKAGLSRTAWFCTVLYKKKKQGKHKCTG